MNHGFDAPLLPNISQFEVDFVIPRSGIDLPIGIDPFLLYKSRDTLLADQHTAIIAAFNYGLQLVRDTRIEKARGLFDFPEVAEIGFGYTKKSKRGSGVGSFLSELIVQTLVDAPPLLERGIHHIEEMQLVSLGIGPDRLSDIAANLLKRYLIEYTQRQCRLWDINMEVVPVTHVFDLENNIWSDMYEELPLSPSDHTGMLFVPRRIVRALPWINYHDFLRAEFTKFLRAKKAHTLIADRRAVPPRVSATDKETVVAIARLEVERIDRYVSTKEAAASDAQPSAGYVDERGICPESEALKQRVRALEPGQKDAAAYQRVILEVLNFLFTPELIDGRLEVKTADGTERRDIILINDSDKSFWSYLRNEHSSFMLMFEVKNASDLTNIYFNQVATYLGDRLGRLGFVVTRSPIKEAQERKAYSIYNDSHPRKIILTLSDSDVFSMLDMKCEGKDPMRFIQTRYRDFRTKVQ